MHASADVACGTLLYVPAMQAVHVGALVPAIVELHVPATPPQPVHVVAPRPLQVPGSHVTHTLGSLEPMAVEYVLATHF